VVAVGRSGLLQANSGKSVRSRSNARDVRRDA
jgi:hypothetical protein